MSSTTDLSDASTRDASPWAAFPAWHGDLRLFGRIATAAIEGLASRDLPHDCVIEFFVRHDIEKFESVKALMESVTKQALREFRFARIRVGGSTLVVVTEFARSSAPPNLPDAWRQGVSVSVHTKDRALDESARELGTRLPRWWRAAAARGGRALRWAMERPSGSGR